MSLLSNGEVANLLTTYGYGTVAGIVCLESFGIPLPGETTLIAAAVIAGTSHALNIWFVIAAAAAGAIIGDNIGYALGRRFGYRLMVRYGRYVWLTTSRIKLGQYLFRRHGAKVVFFGRFVSVLRALAALLAGANHMAWARFLVANAAGAVVWATVYGLAAWVLGKKISQLAEPVGIAIGVVVVLGFVVGLVYLRRHEARLEAEAERALPGPLRPR
ncbi:MAG TPA: DedA family protein [Stellaceae bacterium]|nr:DedA family protein [Stellaceae bacterium]